MVLNSERRVPLPAVVLVAACCVATVRLAAEEPKTVSVQELVRLGFFQDFDELDLEALLETGGVTVSVASRGADSREQTPGIVSVINETQIRRLGVHALGDLLRVLPGFDVVTDGLGRQRIVVRGGPRESLGGGSEGVLVLLDGHRLNEALSGAATFVNLDLPVKHILRLEVLRGPGSVLYGGGALRAVLNIVTRSPRDFQGIELSLGGGSFDTQRYTIQVGNTVKGVGFSGFIHLRDTEGPRLPVAQDRQTAADQMFAPFGTAPASLAPSTTRDNRRLLETAYRVTFKDWALNGRLKSEDAGGYVGFADTLGSGNALDNRQTFVDTSYLKRFAGGGRLSLVLDFTQSELQEVFTVRPPGYAVPLGGGRELRFPSGIVMSNSLNTRRLGGQAHWDRQVAGGHDLRIGAEFHRESTFDLESRSNFDFVSGEALEEVENLSGVTASRSRKTAAAYVQDTWTLGAWVVTGGLRYEHYDDVDDMLTPRVAVVGALPRGASLKLLYGRGFRPPAFAELYFNLPGTRANPRLAPTVEDAFEVGLGFDLNQLRIDITGFAGFLHDPVTLGGVFDPDRALPWTNGPDVRTYGAEVEAELGFSIDNSLFANYTYQRAEEEPTGTPLAGAPRHMFNAGASIALGGRWLVSPSLIVRGARARAAGDTRGEVKGYGLVNLEVRLRNVYKTLEVWGSIHNLFDVEYFDPSSVGGLPGDYPRAGRSAFMHAGFRF